MKVCVLHDEETEEEEILDVLLELVVQVSEQVGKDNPVLEEAVKMLSRHGRIMIENGGWHEVSR